MPWMQVQPRRVQGIGRAPSRDGQELQESHGSNEAGEPNPIVTGDPGPCARRPGSVTLPTARVVDRPSRAKERHMRRGAKEATS